MGPIQMRQKSSSCVMSMLAARASIVARSMLQHTPGVSSMRRNIGKETMK